MLMNNASRKIEIFCEKILEEYKEKTEELLQDERFMEEVLLVNERHTAKVLYEKAKECKKVIDEMKRNGMSEFECEGAVITMLRCVLAIRAYEKLPIELAKGPNGYEKSHPIHMMSVSEEDLRKNGGRFVEVGNEIKYIKNEHDGRDK